MQEKKKRTHYLIILQRAIWRERWSEDMVGHSRTVWGRILTVVTVSCMVAMLLSDNWFTPGDFRLEVLWCCISGTYKYCVILIVWWLFILPESKLEYCTFGWKRGSEVDVVSVSWPQYIHLWSLNCCFENTVVECWAWLSFLTLQPAIWQKKLSTPGHLLAFSKAWELELEKWEFQLLCERWRCCWDAKVVDLFVKL